jgi:hypothetical protein
MYVVALVSITVVAIITAILITVTIALYGGKKK